MANQPRFEVPAGPINGTNRLFYTSLYYRPTTIQVWLNGQMKRIDLDDGWFELGMNKVRFKVAPEVGDVVQIYYIPI